MDNETQLLFKYFVVLKYVAAITGIVIAIVVTYCLTRLFFPKRKNVQG